MITPQRCLELAKQAGMQGMITDVVTTTTEVIALAQLAYAEANPDRQRAIVAAAENLVKVKGRHHSEMAYQQLAEAVKAPQ